MNTDRTGAQSTRTTRLYKGLLLVARVLATLASCASVLAFLFIGLMSGVGHASGRLPALLIVGFAFLIVLPLLLLWPDSGPGTRSRKVHGAGLLGLVLVMLVVLGIIWDRAFASPFREWSLKRSLQPLSIDSVEVEPVERSNSIIGYKVKVRFHLRSRPFTQSNAWAILRVMQEAALVPADKEAIGMHYPYFKVYESKTRLEEPGGQNAQEELLPGIYTLTKQVWMPFVDLPYGATEPCREDPAEFPQKFVDEVSNTRTENWVVRARATYPYFNVDRHVVWQESSHPLLLSYDGASWLSNLSTLSLQPCKNR